MTMRTIVGVAALLLAAGWASSCGAAGETQRETQAIELDKTEMARVEIKIGAGELRVKSGTPKLMEAEFAYNVAAWKPVVNYRADASRGTLTISQPDSTGAMGDTVNTWDLTLNDTLPLDLAASMGAGEANLELGRMNLRNLEVNVGVGELRVDLRGEPKQDYNVQINGGVGEATVYLPRDVGISARAAGGIGEISASGLEQRDGVWVNPDRVNAPVTVHLDVKGAVGEIRLVRE